MAAIHLAVSGLIGAGKSTLVRGLARELGYAALFERFDEDPWFDAYYREPHRWAFHHFLFFFEQALSDQHAVRAGRRKAVQERVVQEHFSVFGNEFRARGFLDDYEWSLIERLVRTCTDLVAPPTLLIHIDIDPEEAHKRLRARARTAESVVDLDYLASLHRRYHDFVEAWPTSLEVLHATDYDFRDPVDVQRIRDVVIRRLHEPTAETGTSRRTARGR